MLNPKDGTGTLTLIGVLASNWRSRAVMEVEIEELSSRAIEPEITLLDVHSILWVIGLGYWFDGENAKKHIRDFLGHKSVTSTEVYARAIVEAKGRALEGLEQVVVSQSRCDASERVDMLSLLRGLP